VTEAIQAADRAGSNGGGPRDGAAAGTPTGLAPRAELRVWGDDACRASLSTAPWPPRRAPSC
jgi:hypothetical protein